MADLDPAVKAAAKAWNDQESFIHGFGETSWRHPSGELMSKQEAAVAAARSVIEADLLARLTSERVLSMARAEVSRAALTPGEARAFLAAAVRAVQEDEK